MPPPPHAALASTQDEVLRDVTAQIRTAAKDMADAVNAIDAAVEAVTEFANTPAEEAATQESPAVLVEAPAVVEAPVAVVVEPEVVVAPPVVAAETAPPPPVVVAPVAPSTPAPAVAPRVWLFLRWCRCMVVFFRHHLCAGYTLHDCAHHTPSPITLPHTSHSFHTQPTVVKSAARGADSSLKTPLQNVMDTLYSVTHGNVVASEGTCTPGK